MFGKLRTGTKLALAMAIAGLALLVAVGLGARFTYARMMEDRVIQLRSVVDVAINQLASLDADVKSGHLTRAAAQDALRAAARTFRFGAAHDQYIFVNGMDGTSLGNGGSQALVGTNTLNLHDASGLFFVRAMTDRLKTAPDGTLIYSFPRPNETVPVQKIVYFRRFEPFDCFVGSGAYLDDIDADFYSYLIKIGTASLVLVAIAGAVTMLIGREIAGSLSALRIRMAAIAAGNLATEIPEMKRNDEIGEMAKALGVFRASLADAARARTEQTAEQARSAREQQAGQRRMADAFESNVGSLVARLATGATELETTARSMTDTAKRANHQASTVAAAAEQASVGVQTVAAAAEELSASISEISRQVAQSARDHRQGGRRRPAHRRHRAGAG